ncbi:MAG: sialate O-acetylesterase [Opitutales bacterium]
MLFCLTGSATLSQAAETRTWTSADGSQTFEGELVKYNDYNGMVTVDRGDRKLTFNQKVLSAEDIEYIKEEGPKLAATSSSSASRSGGASVSGSIPDELPDPDGEPANMRKPVQVFILMGQSNMLGFGNVGQLKGIAADKYPYLVDDAGDWNERKDVRNVFFNNGSLNTNDWMAAGNRNKIGPEIGLGNYLGHMIDAPVLILKSCVGNRALGWDLLPPSADGTGAKGQSYQGNSEYGDRKVIPKSDRDGWYAGLQYDLDVGVAQDALEELSTYYPDATEYEVAGFFWWQGCSEGKGSVENYDKNLAYLFSDLKKDFNAPDAKFVLATLGEHDKDATLAQKMFNFAEGDKDAEVFYSKPVSSGGSCSHYSKDAETYMNVGEGMGKKMAELLSGR